MNFSVPRKLLGGKIITTKLNKTVGYWTDDVLRQALANPLELDFGEAVQVNISRHKREGHVWTDDEIRSSSAVEAELSLEALRELGIEPNENALFDVEVSPKHIADIGQYPFNNYGKLFLTTPTGGAAHCSAAFIRERVLFTAAHCVRNRNGDWYQDFRFHQRFNGMEDQGRIVEVNKPFIYGNYINEQGTMELRWCFFCLLLFLTFHRIVFNFEHFSNLHTNNNKDKGFFFINGTSLACLAKEQSEF